MPYFDTARFTAHYTDTGAGEPIVLLHAGGTTSAHWRKVAPLLAPRYRLLAPDLIGFGATVRRDGDMEASHDDHANLVRAMLATTGSHPVHVVGHSFGGATAMRLAVRYPDVIKSLTLIEPVLTPLLRLAGETDLYADARAKAITFIDDALAGRENAAWERFIDGHNGAGTWAGLSISQRIRFLTQTRQTVAAYRANLTNRTTLADLARLEVPTKLICGAETEPSFARICQIIRDHVPNAVDDEIANAAHMTPLTHPQAVADRIEAQVLDQMYDWGVQATDMVYPQAA